MFISDLEKKTGLTRHTIRFYEKAGFLEDYIRRGENNYRDYSEEAVAVLLNIKAGQTAGFALAELKEVIKADEMNELTSQMKIALICQKMDAIDQKKAALDQVQAYLASMLTLFASQGNGSFHCYNCILPAIDSQHLPSE